jgi:hypothetical protein
VRQLGSWVIYSDVSGQVSEAPKNPLQTVAAVAIPVELERQTRSRLLRAFDGEPVKWKKGGLPGFAKAATLIRTLSLPVYVLHVHANRPEVWATWFEDARRFQAEAAPRVERRRMPYLDGDTALRMRLFSVAFAKLAGYLLRTRRDPNERTSASVEFRLVVDADIRDDKSRRFFEESTVDWAKRSDLIEAFSIYPRATAHCCTEQEEPLLNLPDYVAGIFQHADSRAILASPVEPRELVVTAVEAFRRAASRLIVESEEFREQYPLMHDELGEVHIRPRRDDTT